MGAVIPLFDLLNRRHALERIRKLWKEGEVVIVPHARKEMLTDSLDMLDIENIIRYGQLILITAFTFITKWRK